MTLWGEIRVLLYKEMVLEWRNKFALNGIILYLVSTIFVCFLSFRSIDGVIWNVLFWIILLFTSINAISKSFVQESRGRQLYYYTINSPRAVILAKILYNALLMMVMGTLALVIYSGIFRNPVGDPLFYFLAVLTGSISFSTVFTMVSAIASRAGNNGTLMAVLSFPLIIPLLVVLIKFSKNAMDGLDRSVSYDEIGVIAALNVIVISVSLVLFPLLWRE